MLLAWLIPSSLPVAYVARWIPGDNWRLYVTNNPLLWLPLFVMGICASRMVADWRKVPERTANVALDGSFRCADSSVPWRGRTNGLTSS